MSDDPVADNPAANNVIDEVLALAEQGPIEGEVVEDTGLEEAAHDIMRNPISANCRRAYENQNIIFLRYCSKHEPRLLSAAALLALTLTYDEHLRSTEKQRIEVESIN